MIKKKICEQCGKEYETRKKKSRFCSKVCYWEHMKKPDDEKGVKKVCKNCGKEFNTYKKDTIFCNKKCYSEYTSKHKVKEYELVCKKCGKKFMSVRKTVKYCSNECRPRNYTPKETTCKICGNKFMPSYPSNKICSDKCKEKAVLIRESRRNAKKRIKIKAIGKKTFTKINAIAKETGLSYGKVQSLYPDMDKIRKLAEYEQSIGRAKPCKDKRKVHIKNSVSWWLLSSEMA